MPRSRQPVAYHSKQTAERVRSFHEDEAGICRAW